MVAVAELLISFGADLKVLNHARLSPAEAARMEGLEEAAARLAETEEATET